MTAWKIEPLPERRLLEAAGGWVTSRSISSSSAASSSCLLGGALRLFGKRAIRLARIDPLSRHTASLRNAMSRLALVLTPPRSLISDGPLNARPFPGTNFTTPRRQRSGLLASFNGQTVA